jgi:hypothetical protein
MPHIQLPNQNFAINAATYGNLTIAANAGCSLGNVYVGLVGNIFGPGGAPAGARVVVTAITGSGAITIQKLNSEFSGAVPVPFDFAAYNGGVLYFDAQLAPVSMYNASLGAPYAGVGVASTHKIPVVVGGQTLFILATDEP